MDMDVHLIGSRIKAARLAKKMTQEQLSEKLGFAAVDSLSHIERASAKPSLQTMIRIAYYLDVSLDYLTGLTATPHETMISEVAEREQLTPGQTKALLEITESMIPFVRRFCN